MYQKTSFDVYLFHKADRPVFDILKHKSSFFSHCLKHIMLLIRGPTSSPAAPGVPELKLHPVMVKLCALRHHPGVPELKLHSIMIK